MYDLETPSLFSADTSHSIPVPESTTFTTGTLALRIGVTLEKRPFPACSRRVGKHDGASCSKYFENSVSFSKHMTNDGIWNTRILYSF